MTLVLAGFLAWPAPPVQSASDAPKRGGTLTVAIRKDLTHMNPLVGTRSTDQSIRDLLYDSLLGSDLRGNIQPNVAESWEISSDGKVYTFRLRRGVRFHTGKEMTAEDAKFSLDYTMDPKNGAYGYSNMMIVERVEAPDKYIFRVYLKRPSAAFLTSLTSIQSFSVVPKGSMQGGVEKPAAFPPGTGPFKFVEWKPQQQIVFERHEDYWGQKAFVDRVVLRPISSAVVRFTALRAGDVDIAEDTPREWAKQVVDGKVKGVQYAAAPHAGLRLVRFNVAAPPFNNKKLRQAVAYALDKKEILAGAYHGFGELSDQRYPRDHAWYIEGLPSYSYNPDKAKALLKEAGYAGEPVEILTENLEVTESETAILQAQLKRIGMNVGVKILEAGSYTEMGRRGEFQIRPGGGDFDNDPSITYTPQLTCEQDLKKRKNNLSGYCDREVTALLQRAEAESNSEKRRALFRQIIGKMIEDAPELYLGFVPRFYTTRDHVKNFTTDGDGAYRWWGGGLNHVWLDK
jgi:ABC-type transport system substrate-binding protein